MSDTPLIFLDTLIVRTDSVITAGMGDEIVMMSMERSCYYGLDAIGSKIWDRIETPIRVCDLCQGLLGDFEVEREQCQIDVLAFLNELYGNDIISIVPPTST